MTTAENYKKQNEMLYSNFKTCENCLQCEATYHPFDMDMTKYYPVILCFRLFCTFEDETDAIREKKKPKKNMRRGRKRKHHKKKSR